MDKRLIIFGVEGGAMSPSPEGLARDWAEKLHVPEHIITDVNNISHKEKTVP
ncbi:hypothetical protein [Sedimenticola thiotaurini]|uniref:hypothetical protein n=1 Tax=Sedimenticola thiotaurini TaxID=1543721 RepID=UPI0018FF8FE0|nr:hypothetical protein [Sedimenticola thiotaurini]